MKAEHLTSKSLDIDKGTIIVREVGHVDIPLIRLILEENVKHPDTNETIQEEVESILAEIEDSIKGIVDSSFCIASPDGKAVIGIVGLQPVSFPMIKYTSTENPAEIVGMYVDLEAHRSGVGTKLVDTAERIAQESGFTELVINSGRRYKESGWPFWQKMYGEPYCVDEDYYGKGAAALVWRKVLSSTE